jgi:hypothetical protein
MFTHTFLNIDETRNLTILKKTTLLNPKTPFSTTEYLNTVNSLNHQVMLKSNEQQSHSPKI